MVGRDRRLAVLVLLGGWAAAASNPCHFAGELAASAAAADAAAATATVDAVPTDGGAAVWGRWVGRYSEFHERVVDGRCAPRFLVFEVAGVKGLGNQVMALSAALLAAMVSDRAFVIRWATPVPLTDYLVPTVFNWDAEEVLPHLPGPVIADAVYLSTGAGLEKSASSVRLLPLSLRVRDAEPPLTVGGPRAAEEACEDLLTLHHHRALVIHSPQQVCPMCSLLFSAAGPDDNPPEGAAVRVLPLLLPTAPPSFYALLAHVVSTIFQPSAEFAEHMQVGRPLAASCSL